MNMYAKRMPFLSKGFLSGQRFYNYPGERSLFSAYDVARSAKDSLVHWLQGTFAQEQLIGTQLRRVRAARRATSLPTGFISGAPKKIQSFVGQKPIVTWLGHATFLLQFPSCTIITDPVLSSPSPFLQRLLPSYDVHALPKIDVVLLSHNHRDHMDIATLQQLKACNDTIKIFAPLGDRVHLQYFCEVHEHEWWQQHLLVQHQLVEHSLPQHSLAQHSLLQPSLDQSLVPSCTFLPARHWSRRSLGDYNKSLWGSWMIESDGYKIYFGGDSAYGDHFSAIAQQFGKIDYALLPIGPCEPRESIKDAHMNAEEAGQAFMDLKAQYCVPMHFGTFSLGDDDPTASFIRFMAWWERHHASMIASTSLVLPYFE